MAGKITFKGGRHPSLVGRWLQDVNLTDSDIDALSGIVGRQITSDERTRIDDILSEALNLKEEHSDYRAIRSQDVVATLGAISRLEGDEVIKAFSHCDEKTKATIHCALHRMGCSPYRIGGGGLFESLRPDLIRAAALLALEDLPGAEGGRPEKAHRKGFAKGVLSIWADMTGDQYPQVWASPDSASPVVQFAERLLARIGERIDPSVMVKMLRKVIA